MDFLEFLNSIDPHKLFQLFGFTVECLIAKSGKQPDKYISSA